MNGALRRAKILLALTLCLSCPAFTTAQKSPAPSADAQQVEETQPTVSQQQALGLLRRLANELKSDPDKYGSAQMLARAADALWKHDEPGARALFRQAFEMARQPLSGTSANDARASADQLRQARRQSAALKEIIRRYGAHESAAAEEWLREFEQEKATKAQATESRSTANTEFLAEMALERAKSHPEQALRLGLLSLSGRDIPTAFGKLLFALNSKERNYSNALFREAVAALRRNGYPYNSAVVTLSNYLFNPQGRAYPDAAAADKDLLVGFFLDAAQAQLALWRETRLSGGSFLNEASASYVGVFTSRALSIIAQNAPAQLPRFQSLLEELSAGLSQEQRRLTESLASSLQQQAALERGDSGDVASRIKHAEDEKDASTRDSLLREIALDLMRSDTDRALSVATRIGDEELRAQTEDDIRLVSLQSVFNAPFEEARLLILKFNDASLRAKLLVELSTRALRAKDYARANELLNEAEAIAAKSDDTPDKIKVLLLVARQFETYDASRGFETLAAVVKAANQLKPADASSQTLSNKRGIISITYTVVNGKEMGTGERLSAEAIDFGEVGAFAVRDYAQAVAVGERIQDRLLRAKYLLAVANAVLQPAAR